MKTDILRKASVFASLNKGELSKLSETATEQVLRPGEILYLDGDMPKYFYVLEEGRIKAFVISSLGKEFILGFLGPGEILGPMSILRDRPSTGSMQAVIHTKVLGFDKDEFISFILDHPQVSFEIIKILAARFDEFSRRLRDLAVEKVEQRIARILLMLSSRLGPTLPFTRQELGEMVGATTETTIRIMCQMKLRGITDSKRGKITILTSAKLRRFIEEEM
jgi:CRP-like cAMP-binding protein